MGLGKMGRQGRGGLWVEGLPKQGVRVREWEGGPGGEVAV